MIHVHILRMKTTLFLIKFITILLFSIGLRGDQTTSETRTPVVELSTKPYRNSLSSYEGVTKHIDMRVGKPSRYDGLYTDPEWSNQWPLHDYRTTEGPVMDHNVVPVHRMNITGRGVRVAILADGVHYEHPDLHGQVEQEVWAHKDGGSCSTPGSSLCSIIYEVEGTQVAGVVAMTANNSHCGVGIAFDAIITSIKLSRYCNDFEIARAFRHRLHFKNKIDIYFSSWGEGDPGDVLQAKIPALISAVAEGADQGRDGKGAIYLTDAGNGKHLTRDNCALDALVNSVHTICIAAASQLGKTTAYSHRCPGIFATAYSGDDHDQGIVATEYNGGCSSKFKGTGAACAIGAGIIALVLEANPSLTYRDVQHLITMSAEVAPLADNPGSWYQNGAGFWVSNDFGFGLLNAENMVLLAQQWTRVPRRAKCRVVFDMADLKVNEDKTFHITSQFTNACQHKEGEGVNFLEAAVVVLHVRHHFRGAIALRIISPMGTLTNVLETRPRDVTSKGFKGWKIKSLHNWGENPYGTWKVAVAMAPYQKDSYDRLVDTIVFLTKRAFTLGIKGKMGLRGVKLILHGTTRPPAHYCQLPRTYSAFRLEDGRSSEDKPDIKMTSCNRDQIKS